MHKYEWKIACVTDSAPLWQILQIKEETGFAVEASSLEKVTTYVSAVGTAGSVHHMFSADVDESMRVDGGGGLQ